MTAVYSFTDPDGAVFEFHDGPDGSVSVTAQGVDGPIVCVTLPACERARLSAAVRPDNPGQSRTAADDWVPYGAALPRRIVRATPWTAGGPADG
jgi:hypothetical protein